MTDYKGNRCPVCEKTFKENDDIVVCPDCGTPYHRECWKKVGACLHEAEHAAGFEWTPDNVISGGPEDLVCPNCGAHNPLGAKFCNHCGVSLPDHPDNVQHRERQAPAGNGPVYANPNYDANANAASRRSNEPGPHLEGFSAGADGNIYRKELGPEDPIDGIKARDWSTYVGPSSMYYLMQFFRMQETRRRVCVSFSAFFFGPAYFFFRKMWKQGAFFALLEILLAVPSLLYVMAVSGAEWMVGLPLSWIPTAANVCYVLNWLQMVIRSLYAVYWYKVESKRRIESIYAQCPEGQDRSDALALCGGTSVMAVVIYFIVYIVAALCASRLLGPNLNAVLSMFSL